MKCIWVEQQRCWVRLFTLLKLHMFLQQIVIINICKCLYACVLERLEGCIGFGSFALTAKIAGLACLHVYQSACLARAVDECLCQSQLTYRHTPTHLNAYILICCTCSALKTIAACQQLLSEVRKQISTNTWGRH